MSTGTFTWKCVHCGRPMAAAVASGGGMYHEECLHGPGWQQPHYAPLPSNPGCAPLAPLTEDDVRRIVREEIARAKENTNA